MERDGERAGKEGGREPGSRARGKERKKRHRGRKVLQKRELWSICQLKTHKKDVLSLIICIAHKKTEKFLATFVDNYVTLALL